jgi:hypothetical protein
VIAANKGMDVKNMSTPQWDLRDNYWGPAETAILKQNGGSTLPNSQGPMRWEEFLDAMPANCGAHLTKLNGRPLW